MTKRTVIYARVSTSHHEQKPELQTTELRNFCAARGWTVVDEIVDHGFSGANDKRPGIKKLTSLTMSRQVDVVIVTKLDRLFRSMRHLVLTLQLFSDLGVEFVALHDHIDLTTASGRLMLSIIGAFAEFERDLIRERTIMGLQHAVSKGKRLGRPATIDTNAVVTLRKKGLSYRKIKKQLGISSGAVYRALKQTDPKSFQKIHEKEQAKTRLKNEE